MSENLIPEGTKVKCVATEGGLRASSNKGTPFLHIVCQVIEGPFVGREIPYEWYITATEKVSLAKAAEIAVQAAENAGWNGADPDQMASGYGEQEFVAVITVKAGGEKDDGSRYPDRNMVRFINRLGGPAGRDLEPSEKLNLGAQIRAAQLKMKKPGVATARPATPPAAVNGTGRRMPPM